MGKTKKRGGVIVRDFEFKTPISCHVHDCVPSTFYELGLCSREDAVFIARYFPNGLSNAEITEILNRCYGVPHHITRYVISDQETLDQTIDDLKARLGEGEALLANSRLHQFIVFKVYIQGFVVQNECACNSRKNKKGCFNSMTNRDGSISCSNSNSPTKGRGK